MGLRAGTTGVALLVAPRAGIFYDGRMKKSGASEGQAASELISKRIADLGDWRGETLSRMRKLIKEAAPEVVEEWKWMGTPIWSLDGIITTGEAYKQVVKLTFAKGAFLKDPTRLFNSSLEGNLRRAIDIHEGEVVDAAAFKALVREAVALNQAKPSKAAQAAAKRAAKTAGVETAAPKTAKARAKVAKSAPKRAKSAAPLKKSAPQTAKLAKTASKAGKASPKTSKR